MRSIRVWLALQRRAFRQALNNEGEVTLISSEMANAMTDRSERTEAERRVNIFIRNLNEDVRLKARGNSHYLAIEIPGSFTDNDWDKVSAIIMAAGYRMQITEFDNVNVLVINW